MLNNLNAADLWNVAENTLVCLVENHIFITFKVIHRRKKRKRKEREMISTSTKIVLGVLAVLLVGFILLPSWLKWVLIVIALIGLAVYQFYSDKVKVITTKIKQDVKTDFDKTSRRI